MSNTFMNSASYMVTSESATEGHPDKLCDQISDAVLDGVIADDPNGRVACETLVTTGIVLIAGEITTKTYVDIPLLARNVIRSTGYVHSDYGFDYETCGVIVSIKEQSQDIALGVDRSVEAKNQELPFDNNKHFDLIGAGDQGMMIGFACNETPEFMPLPIALAHKLCRKLAEVRKSGAIPYLRPDGKSQVTVEYCRGKPVGVDTIVISSQHDPGISQSVIKNDLRDQIVSKIIPEYLQTKNTIKLSGKLEIEVGDKEVHIHKVESNDKPTSAKEQVGLYTKLGAAFTTVASLGVGLTNKFYDWNFGWNGNASWS